MNPLVPVVLNLLVPVAKKLISRPKHGIKEGTLVGLFTIGQQIFDQYAIGGIEAVDPTSIAGFVSLAWVLGTRLYQKHKED